MTLLILGLAIFLGVHSVRIVADDWRTGIRLRLGEGAWKGLYAMASVAGLVLIVWGYGLARQQPVVLWTPPAATRHLAALLVLVSFVLLAATYMPRNGLKARLHHPMVLGVKVWALAHLLANGTLADVLLFGSFLVWAVFSFRAARRRDRASGVSYPPGTVAGTLGAVIAGGVAWAVFAFWAHEVLIGVRPLG
ncbi:NnrU family protein [Methylibium sp.]|uniref:NnrU family protein n=1 Tax=Methylibium sp. TaxID=2067992 RepID=UPI0018143B29|nr:NnrU family protein [Methylibium sp.]MBA3590626.1 NnrU family protein [Methylibium sp.]